jgi:deoxyribose-phosphate aldolase
MLIENLIEHTALGPQTTRLQIEELCTQAKEHQFKAVCVPPYYIQAAKLFLKKTDILVCTVIGYPYGYSSTVAKAEEVKKAILDGADELDVLINICAVKNQDWAYVSNDIESVTMAAHMKGKIVKIIIETGLMNEAEIKKICEICIEKEADYVKTSSGVNGEGANVEVVKLIKSLVGEKAKIKASGGIRDREKAKQLIEAGADRLGASKSIDIINQV